MIIAFASLTICVDYSPQFLDNLLISVYLLEFALICD